VPASTVGRSMSVKVFLRSAQDRGDDNHVLPVNGL